MGSFAFRHDSDFNQAFASSVIVGSPNDRFALISREDVPRSHLKHDPEKCEAVFRKDHA